MAFDYLFVILKRFWITLHQVRSISIYWKAE